MPLVGKRVQLAWIRMRLVGVRVSICYLVHRHSMVGVKRKVRWMDGEWAPSLQQNKRTMGSS